MLAKLRYNGIDHYFNITTRINFLVNLLEANVITQDQFFKVEFAIDGYTGDIEIIIHGNGDTNTLIADVFIMLSMDCPTFDEAVEQLKAIFIEAEYPKEKQHLIDFNTLPDNIQREIYIHWLLNPSSWIPYSLILSDTPFNNLIHEERNELIESELYSLKMDELLSLYNMVQPS